MNGRITRFVLALTVTALFAGFSACDELVSILSSGDMPQMEGLSGEIPIGFVWPQTGSLASDGIAVQRGTKLAVEEINNSQLGDARIKLITEDDRSTVEGAVEAYNKLIRQDSVMAILGPDTSSQAKEAFPIAQEHQVVAFSPTSAAPGLSAIGDFVFRTILTTHVLITSGIEVTQARLRYQSAAIIHDETDLFSADGAEVMKEALTANGVNILTTQTFQSGGIDFSAQLTRIKDFNPDVIFVSALPPDKPEILIQARQLGIPDSVSFIINTLTTADVQSAGDAAEGTIAFTSWDKTANTPGNQTFIQNYRAKYGIEPNIWAAQSYATVYILAKAISGAQSTNATEIRDALAGISEFDTILGKFSFDVVGDAVYDPRILVVKDGELEVFGN
jgi:branched-chain amino acid transport system substrate-binding protein